MDSIREVIHLILTKQDAEDYPFEAPLKGAFFLSLFIFAGYPYCEKEVSGGARSKWLWLGWGIAQLAQARDCIVSNERGHQPHGIDALGDGGHVPGDREIVAAFAIDTRKVGKPLHEAVIVPPNCTLSWGRELPHFFV